MKKTEIAEIYDLLDEKEFRLFGEYVRAAYFKIPERIVKLYNLLEGKKPEIISGRLTRKEIAAQVVKSAQTDSNIRRLFSDLNRELENFLKHECLKQEKIPGDIMLIQYFRKKGNTKKAKQLTNDVLKELEKLPPGEETYRLMTSLYSELNQMEEDSVFHKYSKELQGESDNLDAYYISRKLYLFQLMYSKEKLNSFEGIKYNAKMLKEMFEYISANDTEIRKKYPDIFLKYLMLKMLGSASEELILEYREYLDTEGKGLTKEQQAEFYSDLYNYLNLRIADGDTQFREPLLNLYKHLDIANLLYDRGVRKIHLYTYKQILDTAINLTDLEWAEYFAGKYSGSIDDDNRKNIVNLGYAKIFYYKNDLKAARMYLAKVDYRDFIHYLDSKMFLLSIEYDCGNYDEAELIIDATLKYIKNNKELPSLSGNNSRRFIKYMKKLLKFKDKGADEFELSGLAKDFDADKGFIYARNWLKEKINELKPLN